MSDQTKKGANPKGSPIMTGSILDDAKSLLEDAEHELEALLKSQEQQLTDLVAAQQMSLEQLRSRQQQDAMATRQEVERLRVAYNFVQEYFERMREQPNGVVSSFADEYTTEVLAFLVGGLSTPVTSVTQVNKHMLQRNKGRGMRRRGGNKELFEVTDDNSKLALMMISDAIRTQALGGEVVVSGAAQQTLVQIYGGRSKSLGCVAQYLQCLADGLEPGQQIGADSMALPCE